METKPKVEEAPNNNISTLEEKPLNIDNNINKSLENQNKTDEITSPQVNVNYIRQKRIYKRFLKLIKGKNVVNGVIMADILGITRQTVYSWLDTPKAIQILQDNINTLTSKIQDNKDWKASAYLLDKLYDNKEKEEHKQDLKQLIIINTK